MEILVAFLYYDTMFLRYDDNRLSLILIGKERVIWRFDPIIVSPQLPPREILKRIWSIGNQLNGYTDKLVFSFIDINSYRKVQRNLVKESSMFDKETIESSK